MPSISWPTTSSATRRSTIDTILAFNIPVSRAFMHLDTVFTQIDYDKFTIHPGIMGPLTVFEITPDGNGGIKIQRARRGCSRPS
ncbi:MAG: arginine deiminase family protein [Adlercreutzia equolifaciens]